jgi:hypothetical protein
MKKILLAVVLLCGMSAVAQAQTITDVPLLSLQRLSGAVGFDYVAPVNPVLDEYADAQSKLGAILAYRLTKSISVGTQAWVVVDDLDKKPELRATVRWRVF